MPVGKKAPSNRPAQKKRREKLAVGESEAVHGRIVKKDPKTRWLVDTMGYAGGRTTNIVKMEMSKQGITKNELEGLKELTALDYDNLARVLSVTRATLINKKKEEKFNIPLSERIVGLADLYSYGIEVFGNAQSFHEWMNHNNRALGGKTPLEIIDSQYGREEVKHVIGRIEYGVYS